MNTPSASPAPFRKGPSPTKRLRLASSSTPSTVSSTSIISTPPAFSNQTYHIANTEGSELHDARRASSSRILNFWSQLAERYSRPLAEDDIVDLRTGGLFKDRNIMRSDPQDYGIGCFGELDGPDRETETPTSEESDDELDAFAPGADISDELEMERVNREGLIPVREMDPADAEDLREFLEAESRRREVFGSEREEEQVPDAECLEGESGEESMDRYSEVEFPGVGVTEVSTDEVEGQLDQCQRESDDPDPDLELDSDLKGDTMSNNGFGALDSTSDDELGIWDDQFEGSAVYAIAGDLDCAELDAEGVIELPFHPSETPAPKGGRGRPRKTTQSQPPPTSPPMQSQSKSKSRGNMSPPIVQLHTPPQSSSSATGTTPDTFSLPVPASASSHARRAKTMTPSAREKRKPRSKIDRTHYQDSDSDPPPSIKYHRTTPRKSTPRPNPKLNETPSKQTRWVPEVVINLKSSNSPNITPMKPKHRPRTGAASLSQSRMQGSGDEVCSSSSRRRISGGGKGKTKVASSPEPSCHRFDILSEDESDDPMALVSSSPVQQPRRTPAQERPPSDSEPDRFSPPLPITPSRDRGRKRKRVLSSSSEPEVEQHDSAAGMELPVISPDIDLIDFSRRNYGQYGTGHESPVPVSKGGRRMSVSSLRAVADAESDPQWHLPKSPIKIAKRSSSSSRARTHVPSPSKPYHVHNSSTHHYPYSETYTPHHTPSREVNHKHHHASSVPPRQQQQQYPLPSIQGQQAQFLLAQAMHHLSYLMTASGHAHHLNAGQPPWPQSGPRPSSPSHAPPPFNPHNADWAPYTTPTRHRQISDPFDSPPIASSSTSISASTFTTPMHPHPYPHAFAPSLSNATLPPSSPDETISSSPYTPPSDFRPARSKSPTRGRSKSRGRRVSFRIDDDRPHGLSDFDREQGHFLALRFDEDHDDDVEELRHSSPSKQTASPSKGKGKAKAAVTDPGRDPGEDGSESERRDSPSRTHSSQRVGRRFERGQTPGPPLIVRASSRSRSIWRHEKRL